MEITEQQLTQARSFGAAADAYERGRPEYPAEAVDWLLPEGARRVLDLGAGTGKLTRLLAARGLDVVAVEPLAGMREVLARVLPDVPALEGTAESVPLPDADVDAVVVAQAWHWVDPRRAVPELARVLRPGGQLGLVWNYRDEEHDWVAELGRIMHAGQAEWDYRAVDALAAPFGPVERHRVSWTAELTPAGVLDMVASRSYTITLAPDEREALLGRVRTLLDTHPDLAGRERIALPYVTHCYRSRR